MAAESGELPDREMNVAFFSHIDLPAPL